ncbi:hypothetical protein LTS07_009431 [Exophiala sideris]|uniref:NmrA-like domain-containing protein n=1 Tax=Exophiala sideris TaxID=1016849 RepID=A0ABR0IZT7_9EURO|nr:hypothetical protein LTS07_009431 [Exophiala sideris]KAK5028581.1 hypothetical protein LTR13_009032 [Exophiala sideris]KAK5052959.1 hypothetical protein LTR69_009528 [Exophiala sideris]KAK5178699.1 hypothetical protein LTR44_008813 [Eurotiomycetes sp. CCFEE 6388]
MVKIAVAGGSGEVAREVIDVLATTNKHDITILSRNVRVSRTPCGIPPLTYIQESSAQDTNWHGVTWCHVNYDDKDGLVRALRGIDTVLSFIQLLHDPENKAQKNLIDAAVLAGVKRFAPSEWGRYTQIFPRNRLSKP